MYRIAQGLKTLGETIHLIVSSPYLRAHQTARILAKQFDLAKDKVVLSQALSPAGEVAELVKEINEQYRGVQNLALVGHEPCLSRLISLLLSGDPGLPIDLKKGGICRLSTEELKAGRCATLDWLLTPAQLVGIGR